MTADGRVVELWLFPVKSMSGDTVAVADLDAGGLVGDRSWAVADDTGALVTAGREPRLREAVARLVDGDLKVNHDNRSVIAEVLRSRMPEVSIPSVFPDFTPEALGTMRA